MSSKSTQFDLGTQDRCFAYSLR